MSFEVRPGHVIELTLFIARMKVDFFSQTAASCRCMCVCLLTGLRDDEYE